MKTPSNILTKITELRNEIEEIEGQKHIDDFDIEYAVGMVKCLLARINTLEWVMDVGEVEDVLKDHVATTITKREVE